MNEKIEEKLKSLPNKSGVYFMLDKDENIIYIGKAKVLANRVRQYFQNSTSKSDKVMAMVENIDDLTYIITNTELDALALESNLIKKHKPRYNILLKDDKAYPYLRIDFKQDFPSIEIVRRVKSDGAKYFGPFFGGVRASELVELVQSAFMIRACRGNKWKKGHRACLNYHIELCNAPCQNLLSKEEYREKLNKAASFLNGNDEEIREYLNRKMVLASDAEKFEQALIYRERLKSLDRLCKKLVMNIPRDSNFDVFGYATNNLDSVVSVLIVRAGKTVAVECFNVVDSTFSPQECISAFLTQYYNHSRVIPEEIVLPSVPSDAETLEKFFYGRFKRKLHLTVPLKGTKKQLLDTAVLNAEDYLEKAKNIIERKRDSTVGAVKQLQGFLNLAKTPRRIECYDISNISGTDKVSSMVVFVDGAPDKSSYRRFKIKTVEGADDFKSMAETIRRRLSHIGEDTFGERPDLIVIDGGKGQLSKAYQEITDSGYDIPVISLAKREEEVFTVGSQLPVFVPKSSFALKLLQRLRDEAHRFALAYHRNLRGKHYKSNLEEIEGVGKQRRLKLIMYFKSIDAIANATIEELSQAVGSSVAKKVFAHFHGEGTD